VVRVEPCHTTSGEVSATTVRSATKAPTVRIGSRMRSWNKVSGTVQRPKCEIRADLGLMTQVGEAGMPEPRHARHDDAVLSDCVA
jgi:hypothetical protein